MADSSTPAAPIASTTTNPARARFPSFRNRFSNASLLSLSTLRSVLPQYSVTDTLEESPASPLSEIATTISSPPSSPWNSPSTIDPPRYSLLPVAATPGPLEADGSQAPEFQYAYPIRAKSPWATLHVQTRVTAPGTHSGSVQNQPRVPRFWSCDPIKGAVQLDLNTAQNIHQINITLIGKIVLSIHTQGSFLNREYTVWDKSMGHLNSDRLLPGQHMFPFSFPFPTQTDTTTISSGLDRSSVSPFSVSATRSTVASDDDPKIGKKPQRRWTTSASDELPSSSKKSHISGQPPQSSRSGSSRSFASQMPPTFMEKEIEPNVAYDLSVRIVHGRFKSSSKIRTNITYLPASEPLRASHKRREAYEEGTLVPCPLDDPDGWFELPTVKTYGVVKTDGNLRHTRVDCTVYIAQPLSYTRGSVIPCFITIYSKGVEMADMLSSTDGPTVRLLRRVWHPMTTELESLISSVPSPSNWGGYVCVPTSDLSLVIHEVGRANWWIPSKHVVQSLDSKHLEGEIHLSPDLYPSCGFQSFRIEYAVEMLSFKTDTFTPEVYASSPGSNDVTVSNPVEITTLYREDEPVPTAYSDPPKSYYKRVLSEKGADGFLTRMAFQTSTYLSP